MAAAGPAGSTSGVQEEPSYWSASPLSPTHIRHTAPHAIIAFLGTCSFAGFSVALIQQKLLDAILAALLVGLFLYTYTLQSESCRQKCKIPAGGLAGVSVFPDKPPRAKDLPAVSGVAARSVARSQDEDESEVDLMGYAKMLGVSLRNGAAQKENSTLNKILMDALAKEYLRCVSALKCYQIAFGPLPEDVPEPAVTPKRSDPLSSTLRQLRIPLDLEALGQGESRANTPRSPAGIESPDPKRRRATPEPATPEPQHSKLDESPMPAAPTNTPATVARANGSDSFLPSDGTLQESNSSSDDTASEPACRLDDALDDAKPQEGTMPGSFFGLFARQSI